MVDEKSTDSSRFITASDVLFTKSDALSHEFDNTVRENIIFLLFFLTLLVVSSMVIELLTRAPVQKRAKKKQKEQDDESVVKRICSWVCTLTLSTSIGASLLLPISIISNEVLLIYPTNEYLEWLNGMLIQGLWNLVFLFSNLGLFILIPFAHLFIEAEGFSGNKTGLVSKLQETVVVLILVSLIIWGIASITNSLFSGSTNLFFNHINQLPFIFSCISFTGVLILTVTTPLGISRLFTVLNENFVYVPEFIWNLENEYTIALLHHETIAHKNNTSDVLHSLQNINNLEKLRNTPSWKRNLVYPLIFIMVLSVTLLTVFIVMINAIKIVIGFRDLAFEVQPKDTLAIGRSSLSFLGPSGAIFEIILVFYLTTSSLMGLYNIKQLKHLTPRTRDTPTTHLIYNSAIALVLSSALPVFMRILGLTNFDLLGTYAGKIDWIENNYIVVLVNVLFSVLTIVCLINHVTKKSSYEMIDRITRFFYKD